jgi:two-component system, cell cycle sensor histidine kinase and response regulator CckA
MMPVMDGAAAASTLHKTHPHIPVVAMSGLIASSAASTSPSSGVTDFLPKPFTTGQLLRAVRGAIRPQLAK